MTHFACVVVALYMVTQAAASPVSDAPAATKTATLAQLAWIAGHWVDESEGGFSEEIWAAPSGDSMIGMWRYIAKGKLLALKLVSFKDREAAFEGPGQPTGTLRLTYRQTGPDTLSVTLDKDGTTQVFPLRRKSR